MGLIDGNPIFTIDFDFVDHRLVVTAGDGRTVSFPLFGRSVASFYQDTLNALRTVGVTVSIDRPRPFDLPDAGRPFSEDTEHASYDQVWVTHYWQVLSASPGPTASTGHPTSQRRSGSSSPARERDELHASGARGSTTPS